MDADTWVVQVVGVLLNQPEKGALLLVILAGVWRWVRELRKESVDDKHHESFTELLLRENRELRAELKELRRKNGNGN